LDVLSAIDKHNLHIQNHIIWKFNFGTFTKNKYVTSHYHILYVLKSKKAKPTFNTYSRFSSQEKDTVGNSVNYHDREDVWEIKRILIQEKLK
jgi:hypothetical protein